MRVAIVYEGKIPAITYGGIQRSIWYLGKSLIRMGHSVTYLVGAGSTCDFAPVAHLDREQPIGTQIPADIDVAHICYFADQEITHVRVPYLVNLRANFYDSRTYDINTVFISKNHAQRHGSNTFVYNGMDWDDYGPVNLTNQRQYFHFLGKASWSVKNLKGAIKVIHRTSSGNRLEVLGGTRINFNQGFRLTLSPRVRFNGFVGGARKVELLSASKGLILPVIWDEPFGNAMTESMYFGCPVFGTPYGSQPEIVHSDVGFLSNDSRELARAVDNADQFSRKRCHEYAREMFSSDRTASEYLKLYERLLNGETLNTAPPQLKPDHMQRKLKWS